MTLAYVVSRFPVLTETFVVREMQSLQEAGWPVHLFALRHMRERFVHDDAAQVAPWVHFPTAASSSVRAMQRDPVRVRRWVREIVGAYRGSIRAQAKALLVLPVAMAWADNMRQMHVGHVHAHFGSYPALAAMIAAERQGTGFSFTVHAHDLFADNQMLVQKAHRASFIVAISEFNRKRLVDMLDPSDARRIRVIHCGVDTGAFAFGAPRLEPPYRVVTVAALREYKGLCHLVEACRILRMVAPHTSFVCHIVGEGPERKALERQIARSGLESYVRLIGAADENGVRRVLRSAHTFVLPSVVARNGYMDGIPVALMEAMACGVPVVASRLSGIPELVRDAETGLLVPPAAPAALCEAILRVWSEPRLSAERARAARWLIEREYDIHGTSHQLANAFTVALASPR